MTFPTHIVAAGGVVENGLGQVLLVKDIHRGLWAFPGGQVEIGETVPDALIREIREESGANVTVDKLFCVSSNTVSYPGFNGVETVPTKVMFDFICTYIDGGLRGSNETSESRWFDRNEALALITHPAYKERYLAYLEFDGNVRYLAYGTRPSFNLAVKRNI